LSISSLKQHHKEKGDGNLLPSPSSSLQHHYIKRGRQFVGVVFFAIIESQKKAFFVTTKPQKKTTAMHCHFLLLKHKEGDDNLLLSPSLL
jgi:hypothetical protein